MPASAISFDTSPHAADIFLAVVSTEAEVLVDTQTHVIAIKAIGQFALHEQLFFQLDSHCALAAAGQASKPQCGTLLFQQPKTVFPRYFTIVPKHVGSFLFQSWWAPPVSLSSVGHSSPAGPNPTIR
jgi:hypothetical protein